jgi:hypothetical protein
VVVGSHPVELGGRLIVVGTPVGAGVKTNLGTTVVRHDHTLIILRGDPHIVMITVRGIIGRLESMPTVRAFVITDIHDVDDIFILRIGKNARIIPGPLAQGATLIHQVPGLPTVIGAVDAPFFIFDDGKYPIPVNWEKRLRR